MEVISNIALISINETLFVQVISFLIFLFIAKRLVFNPLQASMGEREARVSGALATIESVQAQMDQMAQELARHEAEAKSKAISLRQDLEEEGKKESREVVRSARKEIESLRKEAALHVDAQITRARGFLEAESKALSVHIMEKLLDRKVS